MFALRILRPLKNVRHYFSAATMAEESPVLPKKMRIEREFDFKRYAKRHVLFMISYLGWDYGGYVVQDHSDNTIEASLHQALLKTKLIESVKTANYRRCGRTDKGVSAFRQVISLDVRTLLGEGEGVFIPEGYFPFANIQSKPRTHPELHYVQLLNRVLPADIRVLAWAPAPIDTSARYHCRQRVYKYFFPKGDLDIEAMRCAGQLLIGTHDLRNFCTLDISKNKVKDTTRTISAVTVELASENLTGSPFDMYVLTVSAPGFLWHQIRFMVTVLVLIAQGKEQPDVITKLLDIKNCPGKPHYPPATEFPLILYDCQFDNVKWQWDKETRLETLRKMQLQWVELATKAQMLRSMCEDLAREANVEDPTFPPVADQASGIVRARRHQYKSLMKLGTALSIEEMQARHDMKMAAKKEQEQNTRASESDAGDSA